MKKLIIFIGLYCSSIGLFSQDISTNDFTKYLSAYEYIKNDSINKNKNINVSNTLIDLDRIWFLSDLDSLPEYKKVIKGLTKYSWLPDFYSPNIDSLFNLNNNIVPSKTILFFSRIEENTLCLDLFHNKGDINQYDYNWIAFHNESYMYLFIFDPNGNIKHVFRDYLIYN